MYDVNRSLENITSKSRLPVPALSYNEDLSVYTSIEISTSNNMTFFIKFYKLLMRTLKNIKKTV